ncbi:MAG: Asp-tRNA(Asn)/Glu-tRNA(Gln) amidotransferase subunit GatB [Thiotrichales bacterium]|nr:Asp-tRNA(Asn)/Glu-tRNA(Gln) amidotransferase subunit GatB [Thiotrichales bacterium]MCY4351038.1 Asp-tRNA(Asn)/Glu-tRNA(Gln) amidotransferase subunit GatB [Thiotrichales bacterium]
MAWEAVVGLEIHAQLATRSKIFSGASTAVGAEPNRQACAIDLGLPGVLPVLNEVVLRMAVMFGLATNATIAPCSIFARKNYFYPDLPKGYQISQYESPIVEHGELEVEFDDGSTKCIGITRAHLEEDAGKSVHDLFPSETGVDLNRAGVPLLEIVSEPDMHSAAEAVAYMRTIHSLVRYLGICDGNMEEGSFRCDANVSVRRSGDSALGIRAEIKNLNSFRFVERAIEYEVARQIEILESGGSIIQETRQYDSVTGETRAMRGKEEANDYRYFPDPDLLPVELQSDYIDRVRDGIPELPAAKTQRFMSQYGLGRRDARRLTLSPDTADYYEAVVRASGQPKLAANWITTDLAAALNRDGLEISRCPIEPTELAALINCIIDGTISGTMAKKVFAAVWRREGDPISIIEKQDLSQVSDSETIDNLVDQVLASHPAQVDQYRAGKTKLLGFFVGQVMKITRGQANPKMVNHALHRKL